MVTNGTHSSPHSGPHSGTHSGTHSGSHSGPHAGPYSGTHAGPHSGTHAGPHSGTHSGIHSGTHSGPHSGTHSGTQSGEVVKTSLKNNKQQACLTMAKKGRNMTNLITKMTKEQEAQVEVYKEKFLKQCLLTERINEERAVTAIKGLYKVLDLNLDINYKYKVFESPMAMCEFAAKHAGGSVSDYVSKICWGNLNNYWVAFCSFIVNVLGVNKELEKIKVMESIVEECGPFLIFESGILLSQRPIKISTLDDKETLHCSDGPAIEYADGNNVWKLNNVDVTEEIVMKKPEDFTKEDILNEKNADVRREIVRKIPADVLVKILNPEVIDEKNGYQLLGVDLGDSRVRPFLKMENPSIKTIHIEGVDPKSENVDDAIMFRNQLTKFALPETLDGMSFAKNQAIKYHQQGDALFFKANKVPEDAKLTKSNVAAEGLVRHIGVSCNIYESENGKRFLEAMDNCSIQHPEHNNVNLKRGVYEIKKVLEYDHWLEESREVID